MSSGSLPTSFTPGTRLVDGRVAVVTGGGGGICSAICEAYALHGAQRVVIGELDEGLLDAAVKRVEAAGAEAVPVHADLTTREGMDRLREAALERGGVDILVNGLGHFLGKMLPFEQTTEEDWQAWYEVNLLHVFRATQAFIPSMKERGWGRVINFSSVEGTYRAAPTLAVYAGFKAAVDGFTKSIGTDLAQYGIRVNSIAIDRTQSEQVRLSFPPEQDRLVQAWLPVGRLGWPKDVAGIALFLASDLSDWMTGSTLLADGGTIAAGGWYRTPERWTVHPMMAEYLEEKGNS